MGDWPVGLSTGCFYQTDLLECLEPIRAAGFSTLEICSFPAHLDYHDLPRVEMAAARIRELQLEPYSFHAPFADWLDLSSLDPHRRRRALDEVRLAAEAAARMGVRYFVIHPGPETGVSPPCDYLSRMEAVAASLSELAGRCSELGTRLVLENKLAHLFAGKVRDLLWLLGAMDREDVGICLDTGHAWLAGSLKTVAQQLAGHLVMVHASDNRGVRDDHLAPGEGTIDWHGFLRELARARFRGAMILEIAQLGTTRQTLLAAQQGRRYLRQLSSGLSWEL